MSVENNEDIIWCASFDIGKINFSFYIEEMNRKDLLNIKNIDEKLRFNDDGTPTDKMNKILNKIYCNGKTILHLNLDLTENCKKGKYLDVETYHNMIDVLDNYVSYWDKCSVFVVEQQMSFKGKFNSMALKLGQHCQSYFYFKYGRFKQIVEFPAYYKTSVLGAQKINKGKCKNGKIKYRNIDKPARKRWTIQKGYDIMEMRGETDSILLKPKKRGNPIKLDDYADTLCQLMAFKYKCYVDRNI